MKRRRLNENDVASFIVSAERQPPARRLLVVDVLLRRHNPVRWWRMQRDFKWAAKVLKDNGHDPDEIRWLL